MNKKIGLFCFDGPLYRDKNGIYCNITLTNEMFSRFFCVVDELVLVIRTYSIDETYIEANLKPLAMDNIRVVEAPNLNSIHGMLVEKKQFQKCIRKIINDIDLFFCRMPSTTSDIVISILRENQKKYLVEVGGCAWDAFQNHGIAGKIIAPYMFYNEKKNIYNADFAIYVTKKFLQIRYPNPGITESCSNVYIGNVEDEVLTKRLKKIRNMQGKKIIFGQAVNSIDVKYKGEDIVLKIMYYLRIEGIESEFQVVGPGDGKYIKSIAKKYALENQLKILGTMKKTEITGWYRNIDIYIQPSKQEGLPRSVIEAMSQGVPCLGSNVAGIPELLDKQCLLELNDVKQMVNVTISLLSVKEMEKQAVTNFNKAREYNLELIELRRKKILLQYRDLVLLDNKA